MAQIGPPDFSKKGPPDLSKKKEEIKSSEKDQTTRFEKHEDGSTSIDITEAVVASKKLLSSIAKGANKVVENGKRVTEKAREKAKNTSRKIDDVQPEISDDNLVTENAPVKQQVKSKKNILVIIALFLATILIAIYIFLNSYKKEDNSQPIPTPQIPSVVEEEKQTKNVQEFIQQEELPKDEVKPAPMPMVISPAYPYQPPKKDALKEEKQKQDNNNSDDFSVEKPVNTTPETQEKEIVQPRTPVLKPKQKVERKTDEQDIKDLDNAIDSYFRERK